MDPSNMTSIGGVDLLVQKNETLYQQDEQIKRAIEMERWMEQG